MSGETWRSKLQIGKETTAGTAVAATRILYAQEPKLTRERDSKPKKFMTGTRDNVRAHTLGPVQAGGTIKMDISADEILELLLMGIEGGVSAVTPSGATDARTFTFKASGTGTLDAATVEWFDGKRAWQGKGMRVDELKISGKVDDTNEIEATLFGTDVAVLAALTASLTDRTPGYFEGWETKLYIDDFGDTPGTTTVSGLLLEWEVDIKNNLGRKYLANNTLSAAATPAGDLDITATLKFEADSSTAKDEYDNWDDQTKRVFRLEFGNNDLIEAGFNKSVTVDIPGAWSAVDLTQDDASTRVYEFKLQYVYEPTTLASGLTVICTTDRTTAY